MNLMTFKASSMAEALAQVKTTMGGDAVILHTRTYQRRQWLGLRCREMVEITAGRGVEPAARHSRRRPPGAGLPQMALPPVSRRPAEAARELLATPAAHSAAVLGLSQEVGQLKTMVHELVTHVRQKQVPEVPQELFDYYLKLIENQVAEELATEVLKTLQRQLRPEQLTQPQVVQQKLAEQIEKMIPTSGPIARTKTSGPHVVALVGPTGVGKTTTLAKLAANLKLREQRQVGLITLDTYRLAAVDQLKKYADIIGAPLRIVGGPEELRDAVASLGGMEYVLIDTAGRSPRDALKLSELRAFLAAAQPDEVHLVLSSTASQQCVELAVERFGQVRIDRILFTKLDEAAHVGVVLNVVRKLNKSLSYVTTGQNVPNDIEVGQGRALARIILGNGV